MVTFDDVLPRLRAVCNELLVARAIHTWCVVRDLRGRVRLIVQPGDGAAIEQAPRQDLEQRLANELEGYFRGPILLTTDEREKGRLAKTLLQRASAWPEAEPVEPSSGAGTESAARWKLYDSRLSKSDWLESGARRRLWELSGDMPPVVTFYSFKGGVGRTTALCSYAWQLAADGKRVAVVDLDLEAPGLGSLLGTETARGVIDFVVDHAATEASDLDGMSAPAQVLGPDSERVQVFPAGQIDRGYLDKLARLDFAVATLASGPSGDMSPTATALRALIQRIAQQQPRPDAILIDSRAGLHDLAGLSLHGLAHVDVLLTKSGEQGYRGLELTLSVLAARKKQDLSCIVVHALALRKGGPGAEEEASEFRDRSYELFRRHVYTETCGYKPDEVPALESDEDLHSPYAVYFNADLQRFLDLADRRKDLFDLDYERLRRRIDELTEPEEAEEAP